MKRTKLLALLGAAVLTVGSVGIAFANVLSDDHPNQVETSLDDLISEEGVDEDCSDFIDGYVVGEGQVGLHFILTSPEAETGNITGSVDGTAFGPVAGIFHGQGNGAMHFYVVVDGNGDSVINDAETDVDGGQLTLSHICFGEEEETDEPSFEQSQEGETDEPSFEQSQEGATEPSTDSFGTNGTSGPADGAWLLVVALGVLLASVVVLTPARAKSRR